MAQRAHRISLEFGFDSFSVWRMDTDDNVREVNNWERNRWRRNIVSNNIDDEGVYSNRYGSVLLVQCRTNILKHRWGRVLAVERWIGCCVVEGRRPSNTFVVECDGLQEIRGRYGTHLPMPLLYKSRGIGRDADI